MDAHVSTVDPAEAILADLATMDLSLAKHLHACAMNADDVNEIVNLSRAYQRISRCVRQSLALHARLKRERERAEREAQSLPKPPPPKPARDARRIEARREAVHDAVVRVAWSEYEGCDADEDLDDRDLFLDLIRDVLIKDARHDTFGLIEQDGDWLVEPLDDHVARVCEQLGLPEAVARAWRDLPEPPPEALLGSADDEDGDEPPDESSG